ncbi:arginase family protein [Methylobacterium brachiatum]
MTEVPKTLRLVLPHWQGGNKPTYQLGSRLLAWLAPDNGDATVEVPVPGPDGRKLPVEDGVVGKSEVLDVARATRAIIERHQPDRIVTFGGDCMVSIAPFSFLASKYEGDVAVLWIDAHPDITLPEDYANAHAHVLANLLGDADPDLAEFGRTTLPGSRILFAGLATDALSRNQTAYIERIGATVLAPADLDADFTNVAEWVRASGASKLLVHFDLDVLDPHVFRSQLFAPPGPVDPEVASHGSGKLTFEQVIAMIGRAGENADVVALSITEHLPWDAENLQQALGKLPLLC